MEADDVMMLPAGAVARPEGSDEVHLVPIVS